VGIYRFNCHISPLTTFNFPSVFALLVFCLIKTRFHSQRRKLHTAAERREKKEENSILCMFRLDFEKIRFGDALMLGKSLIRRESNCYPGRKRLCILCALQSIEELESGQYDMHREALL